jgi:hypothetical protein
MIKILVKKILFGAFSWVEVEKLLFSIYRPATHHGQHPTVLAVTSASYLGPPTSSFSQPTLLFAKMVFLIPERRNQRGHALATC